MAPLLQWIAVPFEYLHIPWVFRKRCSANVTLDHSKCVCVASRLQRIPGREAPTTDAYVVSRTELQSADQLHEVHSLR